MQGPLWVSMHWIQGLRILHQRRVPSEDADTSRNPTCLNCLFTTGTDVFMAAAKDWTHTSMQHVGWHELTRRSPMGARIALRVGPCSAIAGDDAATFRSLLKASFWLARVPPLALAQISCSCLLSAFRAAHRARTLSWTSFIKVNPKSDP